MIRLLRLIYVSCGYGWPSQEPTESGFSLPDQIGYQINYEHDFRQPDRAGDPTGLCRNRKGQLIRRYCFKSDLDMHYGAEK